MAARKGNAERLRLLRSARAQIARLTKPVAQRRFTRDIKWLDASAKHLRAQAVAGVVSKTRAKRVIERMARARREIVRLQSASKAIAQRTLQLLDSEIKRLRKGGR
jgi:hypothetical protein